MSTKKFYRFDSKKAFDYCVKITDWLRKNKGDTITVEFGNAIQRASDAKLHSERDDLATYYLTEEDVLEVAQQYGYENPRIYN